MRKPNRPVNGDAQRNAGGATSRHDRFTRRSTVSADLEVDL
jgi:hypothetical protein